MFKYGKYPYIMMLVVTLLFIGAASFAIPIGEVAGAGETIRVALFIEHNQGGYSQTIPFVSLASDTGMTILGTDGVFDLVGDAHYARFMLDHYFLIAGETKEAQEARQIAQHLAQQGFPNLILEYTLQGEHVYRVITGSEASWEGISSLQQELQAKTGRGAKVAGPYRVQAGSFTGLAEANQRLAEIQAHGFTGAIAQVIAEGSVSYQVWVGDEVSTQAQADLQAALMAALPQLSFQAVNRETEYIISLPTAMFQSELTSLYLMNPEQRISVFPNPGGNPSLLQVEERENRSYRGKIELSRYMNKLAVINILPLEEYLYSVVGTEMATGWPEEALKAQAVMSRNYAYLHLQQNKYGIAHVSDTVFEQAYYGYEREAEDVRQAVQATEGEYLTYHGEIFSTFYHSNAGGWTAEGFEVWGNPVETHRSVPSNDSYPETIQATWYRVQDDRGKIGYVIDQYVQKTNEQSVLGYPIGIVTTPSLNYRSGPSTEHSLIGSLTQGDRVTIFEEVKQNNAYSWIEGPYTGQEITAMVNRRAEAGTSPRLNKPISRLEVTERGPSGRVLRLEGDGQVLHYGSPDSLRSLFSNGTRTLRSTKFEVEAMGEYTLLGAANQMVQYPNHADYRANLSVLANGTDIQEVNGARGEFAIYGREGELRIVTKEPVFRLHGHGYGHGLGASQWGIYALALDGYNYRQILQHYFHSDSVIERR